MLQRGFFFSLKGIDQNRHSMRLRYFIFHTHTHPGNVYRGQRWCFSNFGLFKLSYQKPSFSKLDRFIQFSLRSLYVCVRVCMYVCMYVEAIAALLLVVETWFFAHQFIIGVSKNGFFKFLNFEFSTELLPFLGFFLYNHCNFVLIQRIGHFMQNF